MLSPSHETWKILCIDFVSIIWVVLQWVIASYRQFRRTFVFLGLKILEIARFFYKSTIVALTSPADLALLVQAINKITLIYGLVPRFVEVVLDKMS